LESKEEAKEPRCRCGHGTDHHMVSPEGEYTFGGWLCVTFGISAIPKRVRYRCRVCQQIITETTDPSVLRRSMGR